MTGRGIKRDVYAMKDFSGSAGGNNCSGHVPVTYYCSALRGNDANDGRSAHSPLRSLRALCAKALGPGDRLLLERGSVFSQSFLHLFNVRGSETQPIVIDAYGEGPKPRIEAEGQGVWFQDYGTLLDDPHHRYRGYVSSAVLLYDCAYIELANLALTNCACRADAAYNDPDAMNRTGVAAVAQNAGTLRHIHLRGLDIREVHGNVYDKHMNNGGIYFTTLRPRDEQHTGIARYDDVLIEGCRVENVSRWGIAVAYTAYCTHFAGREIPDEVAARYGSTRVVVRGNYVKNPGGDAITTMYCLRPLIEYNVAEGAGRQINKTDYAASEIGRVAAAIWPWKCKNALFQFNEAFYTRYHGGENQDGQAFDADWADGTVYQYNYSHDNEGGCLMICGAEAVNTVFRYNISQNDGRAVLMPASSPVAYIYNNTFYMKPGVPFLATNSESLGYTVLCNNILYAGGGDPVEQDWHIDVSLYENNLFFGFANLPQTGEGNRAENPALRAAGTGGAGGVNGPALDTLAGYRPRTDSPVRGAGIKVPQAGERDFFGRALAKGAPIGAAGG